MPQTLSRSRRLNHTFHHYAIQFLETRRLLSVNNLSFERLGSPLQPTEYSYTSAITAAPGAVIPFVMQVQGEGINGITPTGQVVLYVNYNQFLNTSQVMFPLAASPGTPPFSDPSGNPGAGVAVASGTITIPASAAGAATIYGGYLGDSFYASTDFTPIPVIVQATHHLAFIQNPSNTAAGDKISPPITVAVEDATGNILPSTIDSVKLSIASGSGILSGSTETSAINGIATFSNLSIDAGGAYTLTATDTLANNSVAPATSSLFQITSGKLVFLTQPAPLNNAGEALHPLIKVALEDGLRKIITSDSSTQVTVAPIGFTSGNPITGNTATLSHGIATFSDVVLTKPGFYQLQATDGGDAPAATQKFKVAGDRLMFVPQPKAGDVNSPLPLTVELLDVQNKIVSDATTTVVLTLNTLAGGVNAQLSGLTALAFVAGKAIFSTSAGPMINAQGTYTLTATEEDSSTGVLVPTNTTTPITSVPFAIAGFHLVVFAQPALAYDVLDSVPLKIAIEDNRGRRNTNENSAQVQLSLEILTGGVGDQLQGVTTATFSAGLATFTTTAGPMISGAGGFKLIAIQINAQQPATQISTRQLRVLGYHMVMDEDNAFLFPLANSVDQVDPIQHVTAGIVNAQGQQLNSAMGLPNFQATFELKGVATPLVVLTATPVFLPAPNNLVQVVFSVLYPVGGIYTVTITPIDTAGQVIPPSAITPFSEKLTVVHPFIQIGRIPPVAANQPFSVGAGVRRPLDTSVATEAHFLDLAVKPSVGLMVQLVPSNFKGHLSGTTIAAIVDNSSLSSGVGPLMINAPGIYKLLITEIISPGDTFDPTNFSPVTTTPVATSVAFRVLPDRLVFLQQPPTKVFAGAPFQVSVAFEDQQGNVLTNISDEITGDNGNLIDEIPFADLKLFGIPVSAASSFVNPDPVQFVNGVATFSNIIITTRGLFNFRATEQDMDPNTGIFEPSLFSSVLGTSLPFTVG